MQTFNLKLKLMFNINTNAFLFVHVVKNYLILFEFS